MTTIRETGKSYSIPSVVRDLLYVVPPIAGLLLTLVVQRIGGGPEESQNPWVAEILVTMIISIFSLSAYVRSRMNSIEIGISSTIAKLEEEGHLPVSKDGFEEVHRSIRAEQSRKRLKELPGESIGPKYADIVIKKHQYLSEERIWHRSAWEAFEHDLERIRDLKDRLVQSPSSFGPDDRIHWSTFPIDERQLESKFGSEKNEEFENYMNALQEGAKDKGPKQIKAKRLFICEQPEFIQNTKLLKHIKDLEANKVEVRFLNDSQIYEKMYYTREAPSEFHKQFDRQSLVSDLILVGPKWFAKTIYHQYNDQRLESIYSFNSNDRLNAHSAFKEKLWPQSKALGQFCDDHRLNTP